MTTDDRLQAKLATGFVIPVGTQVVLKVTKALPAMGGFRKSGTVGVVVESPPHNQEPYIVQFADGETVQAYSQELTLRREEVDWALADTDRDLRPYVIYRCQVGSKAFGLSNEDSDNDIRGIYLPSAALHWSLYALPEQLEAMHNDRDEVFWELEKFLRLALKSNPNVLETLWTPLVETASPLALELRDMRSAFLSQHVYKTYSGYVISQFRRMEGTLRNAGHYKPKHAMHLIRLLLSGIHTLQAGEILIDVHEHREELMNIRSGNLSFPEVKKRALELDAQFREAFERTTLPEQPDFRRVDDFLIRARRSMVDRD